MTVNSTRNESPTNVEPAQESIAYRWNKHAAPPEPLHENYTECATVYLLWSKEYAPAFPARANADAVAVAGASEPKPPHPSSPPPSETTVCLFRVQKASNEKQKKRADSGGKSAELESPSTVQKKRSAHAEEEGEEEQDEKLPAAKRLKQLSTNERFLFAQNELTQLVKTEEQRGLFQALLSSLSLEGEEGHTQGRHTGQRLTLGDIIEEFGRDFEPVYLACQHAWSYAAEDDACNFCAIEPEAQLIDSSEDERRELAPAVDITQLPGFDANSITSRIAAIVYAQEPDARIAVFGSSLVHGEPEFGKSTHDLDLLTTMDVCEKLAHACKLVLEALDLGLPVTVTQAKEKKVLTGYWGVSVRSFDDPSHFYVKIGETKAMDVLGTSSKEMLCRRVGAVIRPKIVGMMAPNRVEAGFVNKLEGDHNPRRQATWGNLVSWSVRHGTAVSKSEDGVHQSLRYFKNNYVDYDEVLQNGWFDGGRDRSSSDAERDPLQVCLKNGFCLFGDREPFRRVASDDPDSPLSCPIVPFNPGIDREVIVLDPEQDRDLRKFVEARLTKLLSLRIVSFDNTDAVDTADKPCWFVVCTQ